MRHLTTISLVLALVLSAALPACTDARHTGSNTDNNGGSNPTNNGSATNNGHIANNGGAEDAGDDNGAMDASADVGPIEDAPLADVADDATAPDVPTEEVSPDVAEDVTMGADADAGDPPATIDPTRMGSFGVDTVEARVTRAGRTTPVVAHVPRGLTAPAPVVVFVPGFQLTTSRYLELVERLASHGIVVVRADPPGGLLDVNHVAMAEDVSAVLDWALATDGPLADAVDPSRVVTMGHSLGGKVSVMVAHRDARVGAVFAIDPVNGGNPFTGYTAELPDIVPSEVEGLGIPLGFVGETTNGVASGFSPACAPLESNFETFYDAATASPWVVKWDFTGADHMDFVSDKSACLACSACPAGSADEAGVRRHLNTLATAFFTLHLFGDAGMTPWLTGAPATANGAVTVAHRP